MRLDPRVWVLMGAVACSDAALYGIGLDDPSPDRAGFQGTVCTDDAKVAEFPVKVVLVVDQSASAVQGWDPELLRLRALGDLVGQQAGGSTSFSILGFGAVARRLAPLDTPFTTNPGVLDEAVATLGLPRACQPGACRSWSAGLDLARAVIEQDLADHPAGVRLRTRYVVAFVASAPPDRPEGWDELAALLDGLVTDLRDDVNEAGALAFALHTVYLAAPDPNDPLDAENRAQTDALLRRMSFLGGGGANRFDVPDAIALDRLGLLRLDSALAAEALLAVNPRVLPDGRGDADQDGLADAEELERGLNAASPDTDGDGVDDLIELLVAQDPATADVVPRLCEPLGPPPWIDADLDGLDACAEALVGTDPSLADSDGDTAPDGLEVRQGTNHLKADLEQDDDRDGVPNGEELYGRTDPGTADATSHLAQAIRYSVEPLGPSFQRVVRDPLGLPGISVRGWGPALVAGVGQIRLGAGPTLAWSPPGAEGFGPETPVIAGDLALPGPDPDTGLTLRVEPALLPPAPRDGVVQIDDVERDCLAYTVRNVRLIPGRNDVILSLAQRPRAARDGAPGLFRLAAIPVTWDPESGRTPSDPLIAVDDAEFVLGGE
jgi:hypothetical protein